MRSLPALAPPARDGRPLRRQRLARVAVLLLAVLLLHGLLLWVLAPGRALAPTAAAPPRLAVVRLLQPARPAVAPELAEAAVERPAPWSVDSRAQDSAAAAIDTRVDDSRPTVAALHAQPDAAMALPSAQANAPGAAAGPALPSIAAAESAAETVPPASPAQRAPPAAAAAAADAAVPVPVPVYATRLPASANLYYHLQRGAVVGSGQLVWQRQGDAYEISLEGELQGMPVLGSVSRGAIDADGVAPLRLAERRRSRELRAANFQRDAQRITFSGPQTEYPLRAGAQDRLSWMIQLPGIVEADPSLTLAGARVTLFVVGTRGDAEAWHFDVQGREALELPAGVVGNALVLLREPSRPYDTRVEVWLDPARQHLPVRAVVTTVPGGQPLEFRLSRSVQAGP